MDKQSFSHTFAALEALKTQTAALNHAVTRLRADIAARADSHAEDYRAAATDAINRLNQTIAKIDTVLNENGSSDDHN